jgi:hypothetical protein
MSEEQQLETTTTETTEAAPEVQETAAPDGGSAEGKQAAPTPTPDPIDWTFKFNDQVKEIPEEYRWFKEKDKVEKLKDMYQRAEALQFHKEQSATLKQRLEGFETQLSEYEPIVSQVKQLQDWYGKGDHERVLTALGYGKDQILQLAKQYLDAEKMPPEQKQLYEQNRQAMLAQEQIQKQNEYYKQVAEQQLASLTAMQLDSELGRAEVQSVAKVYDQKFGAGKFRELVISQGEAMVARLGRHVPPSELVPGIVQQFAPFVQMSSGEGLAQPQAPVAEGSAQPKAKVIPNVKGTSAAIGGKSISSIAELKQLRQSMGG